MLQRTDPHHAASSAAATRARVFAFIELSLVTWACIYFALIAVSGLTYGRSVAFGIAMAFALWLTLGAIFYDAAPVPIPDTYLWIALLAWAGWCAASYFWSTRPAFSRAEIGTEIGWGLCTMFVFYVAARSGAAFRAVATTAVGIAVLLSILAIHAVIVRGGDPEKMIAHLHGGVGAFSTYLVLVVPLLPMLFARRPLGYGTGPVTVACVASSFILLIVAARTTENRMIWLAFAAGFIVAGGLAAWRWRGRLKRAPWRWTAVLLALLLLVGVLFMDAAMQRARMDHRPDTTVAQAIQDDPRFALWQHTFERIGERPWVGFGFGKSILRAELQDELRDPMLVHAHNVFVSQWLQTGAIGVAALCALLLALAWRYAAFLRAGDGVLAAIGLTGLAMLAMFLTKNLTDDFMIRPTSKEFWALSALLIGYGIRRERQLIPLTP
jgi:O-antigen ligase